MLEIPSHVRVEFRHVYLNQFAFGFLVVRSHNDVQRESPIQQLPVHKVQDDRATGAPAKRIGVLTQAKNAV